MKLAGSREMKKSARPRMIPPSLLPEAYSSGFTVVVAAAALVFVVAAVFAVNVVAVVVSCFLPLTSFFNKCSLYVVAPKVKRSLTLPSRRGSGARLTAEAAAARRGPPRRRGRRGRGRARRRRRLRPRPRRRRRRRPPPQTTRRRRRRLLSLRSHAKGRKLLVCTPWFPTLYSWKRNCTYNSP